MKNNDKKATSKASENKPVDNNEPLIKIDSTGVHVLSPVVSEGLAKKKLSASLITGIESCAARWVADTFVVRDLIEQEPDNAMTRGSLFHKIMEDFFALPQEDRTTTILKKVMNDVLASPEFNSFADNTEAIAWLKDAINGYFSMGGKPGKVKVANLSLNGDPEKAGLEMFVKGRIGNTEREILGFIDRLVEDPRKDDGSVIIEDWKGLALDTPIPTASGWTTMEKLQEGDKILGSQGTEITVIGKSSTHNRPCYEIVFSDGSKIVTDNIHLWEVSAENPQSETGFTKIVVDSEVLHKMLTKNPKEELFVRNARPIQTYENNDAPPSDPYILGGWISNESLSSTARNFAQESGWADGKVHDQFLQSPMRKRIGLVQGLMDSAGEWNDKSGIATFTSHKQGIAESFAQLVASLGAIGNIKKNKEGFSVSFVPVPYFEPFNHTKNRDAVREFLASNRYSDKKALYRRIVSVVPVASVPTQCIKVDAEDSLFLCGESMIPTHNTSGKAKKWNPNTKSNDGLAEQRQQLIYKMLLEKQGIKVSGARLLYPVAREVVNVDFADEKLAARVVEDVENADQALSTMIENNTFEYSPSFLCAWCPLAKVCPEANIKPYDKMQEAYAQQPDPDILSKAIQIG